MTFTFFGVTTGTNAKAPTAMSLGADARCAFNSSGEVTPGVFEGKKLAYQNKWSLDTCSWCEAQSRVKALQKRLKNFAKGKLAPKSRTVAAALQEWYKIP